MNGTDLVLIGGGGHALVVAEAAALRGFRVAGFYDDAARADLAIRLHVPHLGLLEAIPPAGPEPRSDRQSGAAANLAASLTADAHASPGPHAKFMVALGSLALRARIVDRLGDGFDARAATVVHPSAIVHESAHLGPGVYVGPRAVIHSFARVGAHAIINTGAIVEHECHVGRNAHVAPGAVLAGGVHVGPHTLVGLNATVLPCVRIGAHATVGAGAVVIHDVHDQTTAAGVPARRLE